MNIGKAADSPRYAPPDVDFYASSGTTSPYLAGSICLPVVYSQLRDLDFTKQAARLAAPVYFLVGPNDVNAVASMVDRYYNSLAAPRKELIWLEGGHGATPEQLRDILVKRVLAETYPNNATHP